MAIIKNGANGSVSGKAGSVVFVQTKQGNYVRSLPRITNRKPSPNQLESRKRFKFVRESICTVLPLIRRGFAQCNPPKRAYDCAMSYNLKEAVVQTEEGYALNWEKFMIAKGLPNPLTSHQIDIDSDRNALRLHWEYDEDLERKYNTRSYDTQVLLYPVENDGIATCLTNDLSYSLSHKMQDVLLTKRNKPITYHVYVFFFAQDSSNRSTDSKYLGSVIY